MQDIYQGDSEMSIELLKVLKNSPDIIATFNLEGEYTWVSQSITSVLGYLPEEVIGRKYTDFIHPDYIQTIESLRKNFPIDQPVVDFETHKVHKNGTDVFMSWSLYRSSKDNLSYCIGRDITDRKLAENKLKEAENLMSIFVKNSPASLVMLDKEMNYIVCSRKWAIERGLNEDEIIGKNHYEVLRMQSQSSKDIQQRALSGEVIKCDEDFVTQVDGTTDWIKWEVRPWHKSSGEIGGIIMFTEKITEQVEATHKFRNMVEQSLVGVYIFQDGRYQYVNPKFAEIFGYTQEELINVLPVETLVYKDDRDQIVDQIKKRIEGEINSWNYVARGLKKDGSVIWMEVHGNRTQISGKPAIIGVLMDVSEKKNQQDRLEFQIQLLKELSFITSHELRHEYAKLHGIVNLLSTVDIVDEEIKQILNESQTIFERLNSSIGKLNSKIGFSKISGDQAVSVKYNCSHILFIDDDPIVNTINTRVASRFFNKENIISVCSADEALTYLKEQDPKNNYLIFLDIYMPVKTGWDFLNEFKLLNSNASVILLSSSIAVEDIEEAKKYDSVKDFISKPFSHEILESLIQPRLA